MKVFVTGSAGLFGGHVLRALAAAGHEFVCYDIAENPKNDILDRAHTTRAMAGCDAVIHLAAIPHPEPNVPLEDFLRVNVQGTKDVLAASVAAKIRRFVYGCTGGVYFFDADMDKADVLTEADSIPPSKALKIEFKKDNIPPWGSLAGYYPSKVLAEHEVKKAAKKFPLGAYSLRIDGPGELNPEWFHRGWGCPWEWVGEAFSKALTADIPADKFCAINIGRTRGAENEGKVDFSRQREILGIGN